MTTRDPGDAGQRDNLYEPREDLSVNSSLRPLTRKTSLALEAQLRAEVIMAMIGHTLAKGILAGPYARA